jgi:NAD+-dependent protein deacetylase sirtuin 6
MVVLGMQEQELDFKMPSYSHVAITKMLETNKNVKFVVTSNHDNLHQKSGTPLECISNLFGNVYVEECTVCKKQFQRKVITPSLGRQCDDDSCKGRLLKTQTRMNATTPQKPLEESIEHSKKCDLAIVLGSSMSVSPFCELPIMAKNCVLVTMQETPYDKDVNFSIHAKCDDVMKVLFPDLKSWEFVYEFRLKWKTEKNKIKLTLDTNRTNEPLKCIDIAICIAEGKSKTFSETKNDLELEIGVVDEIELEIEFKEDFKVEKLKSKINLKEKQETILQMKKIVKFNQ